MIDAPVALAFTAGLVAAVNPCGFAMLPAYLAWFVEGDSGNERERAGADGGTARGVAVPGGREPGPRALADRLVRAFVVAGTVSTAFLVVFGAAGILISAGIRGFVDVVPWVALIVGGALTAAGVAVLAGRELGAGLRGPGRGATSRRLGPMFAFGASFAVASLSCTIPVFVAAVATTFTRGSILAGAITFLAYGLGMSTVLFVVTISLAAAQHSVVARLRSLARHVRWVSGALLTVSGLYIVYYWAINLTTAPTGSGPTAVARFVEGLSAYVTGRLEDLGWPTALVVAVGVVGGAVVVIVSAHRSRPRSGEVPAGAEPAEVDVRSRRGGPR